MFPELVGSTEYTVLATHRCKGKNANNTLNFLFILAMSLDFMIAAEDVVAADKQTTEDQQQQQPSHTTILPSQPVSRLFMQRKST